MMSFRGLRAVLVLLLGLAGASCLESGRTPVEPAAISDPRGLAPSRQLVGTTGTSTLRAEAVIGPEGGVLDLGDGHSLRFPAGALAEPVRITADRDPSYVKVVFGPHGLVFPADARPTLTFRYSAGTGLTDADAPGLAIVYLNADGVVEEILGGEIDLAGDAIRSPIGHFSTYAMATD